MFGHCVHWHGSFGKIRSGRAEYFCHRDDLIDALSLRPGLRVEFEAVDTPRGPRALAVRPLDRDGIERATTESRT